MFILEYHSVHPKRRDTLSVSPAVFERQMRFLSEHGYRGVDLGSLTPPLGSGGDLWMLPYAVAITFDDGYRDNWIYAGPILRRFGFRATLFLSEAFVETASPFPWDRIKPNAKTCLPLSWEEVGEVIEEGTFEIGSHGSRHLDLTAVDRRVAREEIVGSKERIEKRIGRRVELFCYPFGSWNEWTAAMVAKAGYRAACRTGGGLVHPCSRFALPRVGIYHHTAMIEFRLKISKLYRRACQGQTERIVRRAWQSLRGTASS